MSVLVKVAGKWQQIGVDASGSGVPWAKVTGGTVTTYTKPDGSVMEVHTFTADGTLTVDTPGYADVLLVGGGTGSLAGYWWGGGGGVLNGLHSLPAGPAAVAIGSGGASGTPNGAEAWGRPSTLAALSSGPGRLHMGARGTATPPNAGYETGLTSDITGTAITYARGGQLTPVVNRGEGPDIASAAGTSGIVIVAVQKSAPTVSGVVASGGTVTDYTGDGVNGVLGQKYKVHTFTADGTLDVSQGGEADALIVGGGGAGSGATGAWGSGGRVYHGPVTLTPGSVPVTVGTGGAYGAPQSVGSGVGGVRVGVSSSGNTGASPDDPYEAWVLSISGTPTAYAGGQGAAAGPGRGGQNSGAGTAGVVIVRYAVA